MPEFLKERERIKEETAKYFLDSLVNLGVSHPKMLVVFAGTPCSGKSRIAADLLVALKGILIRSEVVSLYLYNNFKTYSGVTVDLMENLKGEIIDEALDKVKEKPNGLLILDKGVERTFPKYKKWVGENGYGLFCIRVTADDPDVEKCLSTKEKSEQGYYRQAMPNWQKEFHDFSDNFTFDFAFNTSVNYGEQFSELVTLLSERMS